MRLKILKYLVSIFYYLYNYIFTNSFIGIWKKIRVIIIAFKYSQENRRDLIAQIKAQNIINYKLPQLGKII